MDIFDEEFMDAIENKFKKFLVVSIAGMRKDYYRKELNRIEHELLYCDSESYLDNIMCHYDEVFEENIIENSDEYLFIALKSLTSKQLLIIKLIKLDGFTESEVAKKLNISQQGVHKSKVNTIKKLKKLIKRRSKR